MRRMPSRRTAAGSIARRTSIASPTAECGSTRSSAPIRSAPQAAPRSCPAPTTTSTESPPSTPPWTTRCGRFPRRCRQRATRPGCSASGTSAMARHTIRRVFDEWPSLPGQGHYHNPVMLQPRPQPGPGTRRLRHGSHHRRLPRLPRPARMIARSPSCAMHKAPHRNWAAQRRALHHVRRCRHPRARHLSWRGCKLLVGDTLYP